MEPFIELGLSVSFILLAVRLAFRKAEPAWLQRLGAVLPLKGRWNRYGVSLCIFSLALFPFIPGYTHTIGQRYVIRVGHFSFHRTFCDVPQGISFHRSGVNGFRASVLHIGGWSCVLVDLQPEGKSRAVGPTCFPEMWQRL